MTPDKDYIHIKEFIYKSTGRGNHVVKVGDIFENFGPGAKGLRDAIAYQKTLDVSPKKTTEHKYSRKRASGTAETRTLWYKTPQTNEQKYTKEELKKWKSEKAREKFKRTYVPKDRKPAVELTEAQKKLATKLHTKDGKGYLPIYNIIKKQAESKGGTYPSGDTLREFVKPLKKASQALEDYTPERISEGVFKHRPYVLGPNKGKDRFEAQRIRTDKNGKKINYIFIPNNQVFKIFLGK